MLPSRDFCVTAVVLFVTTAFHISVIKVFKTEFQIFLTDLLFESMNVNQLGMGYWMPVQTHVSLSVPNQYPEIE